MGDFYGVLGVPRSANPGEIRRAYRTLARRYHPDTARNCDARRRFDDVRAAYEVLGNEGARRAYDATLPSVTLARRGPTAVGVPAPAPRVDPPPRERAPTERWRLARALEAYVQEPRPPALAVDVLAW